MEVKWQNSLLNTQDCHASDGAVRAYCSPAVFKGAIGDVSHKYQRPVWQHPVGLHQRTQERMSAVSCTVSRQPRHSCIRSVMCQLTRNGFSMF